MLQIKSISKRYKTGDFVQQALDKVSLNLRDSEFVAILGPSGSGKTTLLNIIGGLDRYDDGDLVINGISTRQYKDRDWDSYRNHTIGFVFQSYNLIPHQTILSNVELALTISGIGKADRRERARKALEKVGLGEHINKKPNQLSGGQMQRVAIARALVNDPDIVLADEPTGALDSDTSVQIMNLLKDVAKDRLVVMVTHNPELAEQYATRIVNLRDGVIRSDSDPFVVDETAEQPAAYKTMGRASVSTGVNTYISDIQRDTMTAYPITVDSQTFDLSSMMGGQMGGDDGYGGKTHKTDGIYPDDRSVKQASSLTSSITENNLTRFKKYLDNSKSEIHQYVGSTGIQYTYDVKFSVFDHDPDGTLVNADGVTIGSSDSASMASQMASTSSSGMSGTSSITSQQMSMLTGKTDENAAPDSFNEIMPGADDSKLVGKVITDNYQVVNGSWPKSKDEVVLVLDDNNSVPLTTLYELGLLPASDYHEMMSKLNAGDKVSTPQDKIDYAKALDQTLYMIPASDQYVKGDDGHYRFIGNDKDEIEQRLETATKLKVVGVVKAKKDASATPLAAGVGYARALTNDLIDRAASSAIVTDQKANPNTNVLNGMTFSPSDDATKVADARTYVASLGVTQKANMAKSMMSAGQQSGTGASDAAGAGAGAAGVAGAAGAGDQAAAMAAMSEQQLADSFDAYIATASNDVLVAIYDQYVSTGTYDDNLAAFGVVSRDAPSSINIYADSFEDKDHIADAITDYNNTVSKKDKITYTDYVGLMMSSVTTIVNVISYVLIAFVSVSLIVSSIMIGIITYISVLERTKEIGILRAMGASKHNVSQVFNAETGIIGLCSGLLGVGLTVLLNIPINAVLHHFIGNADVNAALPVTGGVVLVILSVVLTLIGGLIPSRKAAKQDPATALRTE